jgi:hypothetical protein
MCRDPRAEPLERRTLLALVGGSLAQWQTVELTFQAEAGVELSELSANPNPFFDFRLQVAFTHRATGRTYDVPGYFDGDGLGGGAGGVWKSRFTPDLPGEWAYQASFRTGPGVAVSLDPAAGMPVSSPEGFDADFGYFAVAERDPDAPGFLKHGRLEYDAAGTILSKHYLKFRDGPYFIKSGLNSPENWLAYTGFDNTTPGPYPLHDFDQHAADWREGDPDWGDGRGKAIVGAINYLAVRGINSIYFLTMSIGGDAQDVWPFAGQIDRAGSDANDNLHYDVGKLAQWETVFAHAQRKGVMLHPVLGETETANKLELDAATLGPERMLFFREMIARFGHHNALQWNVTEEYDRELDFGAERVKGFAGYLQAVDPYDHPIVVHFSTAPDRTLSPFLGDPRFSSTTMQYYRANAGRGLGVEKWRGLSEQAGRPWPINLDEFQWTLPTTASLVAQRKEMLWTSYFSGAAGLEYFLANADGSDADHTVDDFRPYERLWDWTRHARQFVQDHLPFWQMAPADALVTGESPDLFGAQVYAKLKEVYAIYLPKAAVPGTLDLTGAFGRFEVRWFNPRTGVFEGTPRTVPGGRRVSLRAAPHTANEDWVVLVKRAAPAPEPPPAQSRRYFAARPVFPPLPVLRERAGVRVFSSLDEEE